MKTRHKLNRRQLLQTAAIEQDQHPGDPDIRETCREYLRIMREYI